MCLLILLCVSIGMIMSGCTSDVPASFAGMDKSDDFKKVIVQTGEMCTFEVDITTFEKETVVYEGEEGTILLAGIEETSSNTVELQFKAQGNIHADRSTIMTACAYKDDGFMQSSVTVEPSENVIAKCSLMTTELKEFGNYFSITILFKNCDVNESGIIKVTLQDLVLIEFYRN